MFKLLKLPSYYLRTVRGLGIIYVLLGYFWINWLSKRKFTSRFIPRKYKVNGSVQPVHMRLRMMLERLGPTFVKFGQILADRPDIISEKFRVELKKLQSTAEPFDHDLARELIEKELGAPIETYFRYIEPQCIGSASIGQVYMGVLHNGEKVVVKIQRPVIREKIDLDLKLLNYLADKLSQEYPELVVVNISGFVKEFGETMMRELNYLHEAGNAIRFSEMFMNVPYCRIPVVHMDLCTHRLLVMEFMEGITPESASKLERWGRDPKIVAENGINIFLKMVFEHGFFHADMHAGNLFIQENNRVALIDFGMVGALKPSHMEFLANFTQGLAFRNAQTISKALLDLSNARFFKEKEDLEFRVQEMLNRYGSMHLESVRFSEILDECVKIILRFELKIPSSIYLLLKAIASMEKLGYNLRSEMSLAKYIRPYAENLIRQQYSLKAISGTLVETVKNYITLVKEFPGEMSEILDKAKQGKLTIEIKVSNEDLFRSTMRGLGRRLATGLVVGFMFTGAIIMNIWGTPSAFSNFLFVISSIFAIWLVVRLFFTTRV
ncbi:MAG: AarF/UbiB family protein [Bacteroidota bacterium]